MVFSTGVRPFTLKAFGWRVKADSCPGVRSPREIWTENGRAAADRPLSPRPRPTAAGGRLFRGAYRGLFGRPALGKLSVRRGEPDPNEDGRPLPNIRAMSSSHARLGEGDASTDRITDADINNVVTSAGSAGGIRHDFACPPATHSGLIVRDNPAAKRPDPSSS